MRGHWLNDYWPICAMTWRYGAKKKDLFINYIFFYLGHTIMKEGRKIMQLYYFRLLSLKYVFVFIYLLRHLFSCFSFLKLIDEMAIWKLMQCWVLTAVMQHFAKSRNEPSTFRCSVWHPLSWAVLATLSAEEPFKKEDAWHGHLNPVPPVTGHSPFTPHSPPAAGTSALKWPQSWRCRYEKAPPQKVPRLSFNKASCLRDNSIHSMRLREWESICMTGWKWTAASQA